MKRSGGIETYLGIQRQLRDDRVEEIKRYVTTIDATFPSAVILAVEDRCASITPWCQSKGATKNDNYEAEPFFKLTLRNIPNPEEGEEQVLLRQIATVLDGQHRIAGLEGYSGPDFYVNIAVFIGLDVAMQANIFSVVNLAQTKVNPSLVYDLFAYDKARSPEKTAHEVAVGLDGAPSSPFYKMIKRLGVATDGRFGETLSQATFVRGLLPYLTDDVMRDRDLAKRNKRLPEPSPADMRKMIFRKHFLEKRDLDIAAVVWAYFEAVQDKWPDAWTSRNDGLILNKTTGYQAFMKFLGPAYNTATHNRPGNVPGKSAFAEILKDVRLNDADFTTETFKPGSSGTAKLYRQLMQNTGHT